MRKWEQVFHQCLTKALREQEKVEERRKDGKVLPDVPPYMVLIYEQIEVFVDAMRDAGIPKEEMKDVLVRFQRYYEQASREATDGWTEAKEVSDPN